MKQGTRDERVQQGKRGQGPEHSILPHYPGAGTEGVIPLVVTARQECDQGPLEEASTDHAMTPVSP